MRLKEYFWMLGLKPKPKEYGFKKVFVDLATEGHIEVAQWLHPKAFEYLPSQEEINELKKFLSPGDVCLDIGGYTGDTAIPAALAVGKTGVVFALEPNKYVYKILAANAALNKEKTNIIPLPFAATTRDEEMEFNYSDSGFGNGGLQENISKWKHGHAFKLKVQGKNLIDYLEKNYPEYISRIKYIKVDVEGYDYTVLQTLNELIKKQRPYIKVEVFKYTDSEYRNKLYAFFIDHGYEVFFHGRETQFFGEKLSEAADMLKKDHFDIIGKPL